MAPPDATDPTKTAVYVRSGKCEETEADGVTDTDAIVAHVSIGILDPLGGPETSFYSLFTVTDSEVFYDWARQASPDYPVYLVSELTHETVGVDNAIVGGVRRAIAPGPHTPSPFTLNLRFTDPPLLPITGVNLHVWTGLPGGDAVLHDIALNLQAGSVNNGDVSTEPGTRLAELLGGTYRQFSGYTGNIGHNFIIEDVATIRIVRDHEFPQ